MIVYTLQCEAGEKGMAAGLNCAVIPMQMMMRKSSKRRRFPIQILRRLLPEWPISQFK